MTGPWIKLWRNMLTDPTIAYLIHKHGHEVTTFWIGLLTSAVDGTIEADADELAFTMQIEAAKYAEIATAFEAKGLIESTEAGIVIVNWKRYQEGESTERSRRHRERAATPHNIEGNAHATPAQRECNAAATEMQRVEVEVEVEEEVEKENNAAACATARPEPLPSSPPREPPRLKDDLEDAIERAMLSKASLTFWASPPKERASIKRLAAIARREAPSGAEMEWMRRILEKYWLDTQHGSAWERAQPFTPSMLLSQLERVAKSIGESDEAEVDAGELLELLGMTGGVT